MNSILVKNIFRFVFLVLLQGLVLSRINLFGYINPYFYVLFILLLPIKMKQTKVLFWSFLLGLCVDFFAYSGGVHAAACLVIAYLRPAFLRLSFGVSYESQTMKLQNTSLGVRLQYISLMVMVHHFVLFSLEVFNFAHIFVILKRTLLSGLLSTILLFLSMIVFVRHKK